MRAMESRVESVELGGEEEISGDEEEMRLDISALTQYSGQGKCWWMKCSDSDDTATTYREGVRSWAGRINWTVEWDLNGFIIISRKRSNP